MEKYMMVNGKMGNHLASELKRGQMEENMRDYGEMESQ